MRELKFRAWIKKEKRMLQPLVTKIFNDGDSVVELMQFTGLQDKDGVDIYEGDIVEFKSGAEWQGISEFHDVGVVEYDHGLWLLKTKKARLNFAEYYSNVTPVIIGNKFENPELLEGVLNKND